MPLYQIPLPLSRNDGHSYDPGTRRAFLRSVGLLAGGYTVLANAQGFWRDPLNGKEYVETMTPLQVSCSPDELEAIELNFRMAFPDQKCLMVATLGDVQFRRFNSPEP